MVGGHDGGLVRVRAALVAGLVLVTASLAACGPRGTKFEQLKGRAIALNERGLVVGTATFPGATAEHAFVYDRATGRVTDLGAPGGESSGAVDVNDNGLVAGYVIKPLATPTPADTKQYVPVVWNVRDGSHRVLATDGSYATVGINNAGYVVGNNVTNLYPESITAYLWAPDGTRQALPKLTRVYSRAFPNAINEAGWVAGSQGQSCCGGVAAWLWRPDQGTVELPSTGSTSNFVYGLNDRGDAVGSHWWAVPEAPAPPGEGVVVGSPVAGSRVLLQDVNAAGTAVGSVSSGTEQVYCVKLPAGAITQLPGRRSVFDLNEKGEIAGSSFDADGTARPAVWPAGTCP